MLTRSILAGAAIALATTVGPAYAADQFTTLGGVTADAMSNNDMDAVYGTQAHFNVLTPGAVGSVSNFKVASMQAAGFLGNEHGLRTAEVASGVIDVIGFAP